MASSGAVKSGKAPPLGDGHARRTVSADFEMAEFPGYDRDVQQAFRSLGEEYNELCEVIAAEDPELDPAYEVLPRLP